ncbi:Uncharacterised protein [Mycobacteroides abscessus subsp. abscessus]|nr:Uncharacterised protein [Mycobacteroides abscessus subsp. abscessus]
MMSSAVMEPRRRRSRLGLCEGPCVLVVLASWPTPACRMCNPRRAPVASLFPRPTVEGPDSKLAGYRRNVAVWMAPSRGQFAAAVILGYSRGFARWDSACRRCGSTAAAPA